MRSRPSTAAVLAAYQVLRPTDLVPPLKISDTHFEQLRAALAAAYRIDYATVDQVKLARAIMIYRGAIGLLAQTRPMEEIVPAVLLAANVLEACERHVSAMPEEEVASAPQLSL